MKNTKMLLLTASILSFCLAHADKGQGQRGAPPELAISVCSGQSSGATCKMTGRKGEELEGVCEDTPDGKYFACKPNRKDRSRGQEEGQQRGRRYRSDSTQN